MFPAATFNPALVLSMKPQLIDFVWMGQLIEKKLSAFIILFVLLLLFERNILSFTQTESEHHQYSWSKPKCACNKFLPSSVLATYGTKPRWKQTYFLVH